MSVCLPYFSPLTRCKKQKNEQTNPVNPDFTCRPHFDYIVATRLFAFVGGKKQSRVKQNVTFKVLRLRLMMDVAHNNMYASRLGQSDTSTFRQRLNVLLV